MRDTYMSLPFQRLYAVNLYEFVQKISDNVQIIWL